jgi:hypothetical protein
MPTVDPARIVEMYKPCVLHIETEGKEGDLGNGTAFHIGDGYLVTARHVINNRIIKSIRSQHREVSTNGISIYFSDDPEVDIAVLGTDFNLDFYMSDKYRIIKGEKEVEKFDHIPLGTHLDDWIDDGFYLMEVVLMGFPPIPLSKYPVMVAVRGEINAVVDPYAGCKNPLFVISPLARGGFSGGPVLVGDGWLLGVLTNSLVENGSPPEMGYHAAISIEPLWEILFKNRIFPGKNVEMMYLIRHGWDISDEEFPLTAEERERIDSFSQA